MRNGFIKQNGNFEKGVKEPIRQILKYIPIAVLSQGHK
jgi:hypothetical protein